MKDKKIRCKCGITINKFRLSQHNKSKRHNQFMIIKKMEKSGHKLMYDPALINFLERSKHLEFKKVPVEYWYFVPKEVVAAHNIYIQNKHTTYAGISYRKFMEGVFAK